ncbi:MAG: hypothetical protein ABW209_07705, partial [Pseudomonas caspiana]
KPLDRREGPHSKKGLADPSFVENCADKKLAPDNKWPESLPLSRPPDRRLAQHFNAASFEPGRRFEL